MSQRGFRRSIALAMLCSLVVVSCRTPRTQLLVVVALDPIDPPADRIGSVAITVRSSAQPDPPRVDGVFTIGQSAGQTTFPFSFGVYPENEAAERRADIVIDACAVQGCAGREGGTRPPLVRAHANVGFVRGETRVLTIRLSQRCAGVTCLASQTCDPDVGRCVSAGVDASTLPTNDADAGNVDAGPVTAQVAQVAAGGGLTCFRMTDGTVRCAGGASSLAMYSNFPGSPATSTPALVPGLEGAIDVTVGYGHACALMPDRTVKCWGGNQFGQLGSGTTDSATPRTVGGLHDVAQISLGGFFSCARLVDGTVTCWGLDATGELGDGEETLGGGHRVTVPGLRDVVEIAAGGFHACARLASGSVECWGSRRSALGDGTSGVVGAPPTTPVAVLGLDDATQITAGGLSSCARRATGAIVCWGSNLLGQTGTGVANAFVPSVVTGIDDAVEVRAGAFHACARGSDGRVACWGRNDRGQVGSGDRETQRLGVTVAGIGNAIALSVGSEHSCVQRSDRSVVCWGDDSTGQLASGRPLVRTEPVQVPGLDAADSVSGGALHTCALRDTGVSCWGLSVGTGTLEGLQPPIQDGLRASNAAPRPVVHLEPVPDRISVGNGFACAHMVDGTVRCWGHNDRGQLGSGTSDSLTPLEVDGLVDTAEVQAAYGFVCARSIDGSVRCWGNNASGTLGVSRITTQSARPVLVEGIGNATHLAAQDEHVCTRLADGRVACWGANYVGQLGNATSSREPVDAPVIAVGITDAMDVGALNGSNYAHRRDGGAWVWGWNGSGLLRPDRSDLLLPTPRVTRLPDFVTLRNGALSSCIIDRAGMLSCWGQRQLGGVGDGTSYVRPDPVPVDIAGGNVTDVSMGDEFGCALAHGEVFCWGDNTGGQVGDGTGELRLAPVRVSDLSDVASIDSFGAESCAVTRSHEARCWGLNDHGSLGNGTRADPLMPVDVAGIESVTIASVSPGFVSSCALDTGGGVWCWGANDSGELGTGDSLPRSGAVRVAMPTGSAPVTEVVTGLRFSCALAGGEVYCWGLNRSGQLGDGTGVLRAAPVRVIGLTGVRSIAATTSSMCAIAADRTVLCWGQNDFGQLGSGTIAPSAIPALVPRVDGITQLAAGYAFVCALRDTGAVQCWGDHQSLELGPNGPHDPPLAYSTVPVDVPMSRPIARLFAGGAHVCAVTADATRAALCWGDNAFNQITPGTTDSRSTPVEVTQASGADELALGEGHACVRRGATVQCWGQNTSNELGDGSTATVSASPRGNVLNLDDATAIASRSQFTCAVRSNGGVRCWGSNNTGTLGDGTRASALSPVSVVGLGREGVASISSGAGYTCARLGNGSVRCWGGNFQGQLGESLGPDHTVPTLNAAVGNLPNVIAVATGTSHACALASDHHVQCWGANDRGQLGVDPGPNRPTPIAVALENVVDLAAGGAHTCAVLGDGTVHCWGANDKGQVNGSPSPVVMPGAPIAGVPAVQHVVAGGAHTCAWADGGRVWCWGNNARGQLGRVGGLANAPAQVAGLEHVTSVSAGADLACRLEMPNYFACRATGLDHTCALAADGTAWCWGRNDRGELGDGSTIDAATPVAVRGLTDATSITAGGDHSCARRANGSTWCWGSDAYGQLGTGVESWRSTPASVVLSP